MTSDHGYVATWRGAEYEASPAPDGQVRLYVTESHEGFAQLPNGRGVTVVPADEVELRYVRVTCMWRGARCMVIGEHGGWLRLEYLGDVSEQAEHLGMDRFDLAVYQGWAPRSEVSDLVRQQL
ncbi:MAG: hypothetical protein ACRDT8_16180 [Micromonosporaceae bacterium]